MFKQLSILCIILAFTQASIVSRFLVEKPNLSSIKVSDHSQISTLYREVLQIQLDLSNPSFDEDSVKTKLDTFAGDFGQTYLLMQSVATKDCLDMFVSVFSDLNDFWNYVEPGPFNKEQVENGLRNPAAKLYGMQTTCDIPSLSSIKSKSDEINPCIGAVSAEVKDQIQHTLNVQEDPLATVSRLQHLNEPTGECLIILVYANTPQVCIDQFNFFKSDLKDILNNVEPYNGCGARMGLLDMDTRLDRMLSTDMCKGTEPEKLTLKMVKKTPDCVNESLNEVKQAADYLERTRKPKLSTFKTMFYTSKHSIENCIWAMDKDNEVSSECIKTMKGFSDDKEDVDDNMFPDWKPNGAYLAMMRLEDRLVKAQGQCVA